MIKIIVLICSITLSQNFCTTKTASHVISGPFLAQSEAAACQDTAKAFAISIAKSTDLRKNYVLFACRQTDLREASLD